MQNIFTEKHLTAQTIDARIRELNWQLRAIAQWREPDPNATANIVVKDNISLTGFRTTAGSYAFKAMRAEEDAFCVKQLKRASMNPFAKATMSELAGFVSSTLSPGYSELGGQGINPHHPDLSPGGSSSGSAIAVAAGLCHAAVGTETHGSIVSPAIACGVVGMKPSVGLISRTGVVPISHSLDTPGALARNVVDAAHLVEVMAGRDSEDPATEDCPERVDFTTNLGTDTRPVKLALIPADISLDEKVKVKLEVLKGLARAYEIEIIDVPMKKFESYYKTISSTEIQGDMNRFLARFGNGSTPSTFTELVRFYEMREQRHAFGFDRLTDALSFDSSLDNTSYQEALTVTLQSATKAIDETLSEYGADGILCVGWIPWWALARAPYIALPFGAEDCGKRVGLTLGARRWEDRKVFDLAAGLEKVITAITD